MLGVVKRVHADSRASALQISFERRITVARHILNVRLTGPALPCAMRTITVLQSALSETALRHGCGRRCRVPALDCFLPPRRASRPRRNFEADVVRCEPGRAADGGHLPRTADHDLQQKSRTPLPWPKLPASAARTVLTWRAGSLLHHVGIVRDPSTRRESCSSRSTFLSPSGTPSTAHE